MGCSKLKLHPVGPEVGKTDCNSVCKMMCCIGRCGQTIVYGPSDPDNWYPDLDWLEDELESANPPKLVYIVNPCNPTGWLACQALMCRRQVFLFAV